MTFQYFVIQPDGTAEVRESASREQFIFDDLDAAVGVGGHGRVRLDPGWLMTGYVNDCGLLPTLNLERNVVGGTLLGVFGAARQPYAGPVVVVGWDSRATYLGQLEVESLSPTLLDELKGLVADIRIVLGMDEGTSIQHDPRWVADVRMFAEHIRTAEVPAVRVVSGDDAVAHVLATLHAHEGMSPDCCRELHGCCPSASCRCACHADQEFVPVRGWLPVAQARADRMAYLDEDAAIQRACDHERD